MAAAMNKRVECPGMKESFQIVSKAIHEAPARGLVLKNHYSGICHSDLHSWFDGWRMTDELTLRMEDIIAGFSYPAIYGHEIAGEVYSLGAEYSGDLKVGDLVAVHPWVGCKECGACKADDDDMCARFADFNVGVGKEGGFQQYTAVTQAKHVLKVPECLSLPVASIMTCSAITAYSAVNKIVPSVERAIRNTGKAVVLIIGAGGVGLWGIQFSKALLPAATKVFVADISDDKLQGGLAHGADEAIMWDRAASEQDLIALTKEKTGGGVDGSLDFVGLAATSGQALACTNKGATCITVGLAGGTMKLPLAPFIFNHCRMEGSLVGNLQDMHDMLRVFQEKHIKSTPITLVKPEDTERCLRELAAGTFQGRYVIDWTKE